MQWFEFGGKYGIRFDFDTILTFRQWETIAPAIELVAGICRGFDIQCRIARIIIGWWRYQTTRQIGSDSYVITQRFEVSHKGRIACIDRVIQLCRSPYRIAIFVLPMVERVTVVWISDDIGYTTKRLFIGKLRYRAMRFVHRCFYRVEIRFEIGNEVRILRRHAVINGVGCAARIPTRQMITILRCGINLHIRLIFVLRTVRHYGTLSFVGFGLHPIACFAECGLKERIVGNHLIGKRFRL